MLTSTWSGPSVERRQRHRRPPQHQADDRGHRELPPADCRADVSTISTLQPEPFRRRPRDQIADQRRGADDQRKRQRQKENADEGRARQRDQQLGLERALADAQQRLDHDHQHGGLDAEQRAVDQRNAAPERIEQAQAQHHERARQHEQDAGHEPAAHAMQQPADIGRELLRLRPRQQHAEVERVQETLLLDPFLLVDHDAMHHGDLAGRPAEVDAGRS